MTLLLDTLPFIDLYVRLDRADQAYFRSKERGQNVISQFVPPEFEETIERFRATVSEKLKEHPDGAITFDEVRCRLAKQHLNDGSAWVCARRINTILPDIEKLGLPSAIVGHMLTLGRRDGLVVISGATGAGKTTTAVALLGYFLRNYGGTALTIEDPCEFMIAGRHGTGGMCYQVEVEKEEDWALGVKRALRWAPRYIYVGEIRTPKAAEQVLRAATTGHLVMTTVHAGAMEEALMGIIFLAEQSMGSGAYTMLATGLTALVNQALTDSGPVLKYLYTEENSPGDPVRSLIRENKIGMLSTYIDRTAARLQNTAQLQTVGSATKQPVQAAGASGGKKA